MGWTCSVRAYLLARAWVRGLRARPHHTIHPTQPSLPPRLSPVDAIRRSRRRCRIQPTTTKQCRERLLACRTTSSRPCPVHLILVFGGSILILLILGNEIVHAH